MNRKTNTTIGLLRVGDRFCFLSDFRSGKVYEVTSRSTAFTWYNKVENEKKKWLFDKKATLGKEVIFLRHTVLLPGDECFLQDLSKGDKFCNKEGIEGWILEKTPTNVKVMLANQKKPMYGHHLATVILVHKLKDN